MTIKTFSPYKNKRDNDSIENNKINAYWPKALVTNFMMNRNKVTRLEPAKDNNLQSKIHNLDQQIVKEDEA